MAAASSDSVEILDPVVDNGHPLVVSILAVLLAGQPEQPYLLRPVFGREGQGFVERRRLAMAFTFSVPSGSFISPLGSSTGLTRRGLRRASLGFGWCLGFGFGGWYGWLTDCRWALAWAFAPFFAPFFA